MSHVRKQIRDYVATLLTGLSATGSRVYPTRAVALAETDLPAIAIYTTNEEAATQYESASRPYMVALSLVVEVFVAATSAFDDAADAICVEVQEALGAARTLGGIAFEVTYRATEFRFVSIQGTEGGSQQIGSARLTYDVQYQVLETDLETAL